jgi:hypothetical protein
MKIEVSIVEVCGNHKSLTLVHPSLKLPTFSEGSYELGVCDCKRNDELIQIPKHPLPIGIVHSSRNNSSDAERENDYNKLEHFDD